MDWRLRLSDGRVSFSILEVVNISKRRVSQKGTGTRDFYPAVAALVSPVQNIFPSPYTIYVSPSYTGVGGDSVPF